MKPSFETWQVNRWPLIELGMTRQDCLRWLERHDYPIPPKSACIGCPFHSNAYWRHMRDHDPEGWTDAVSVDAAGWAFSIGMAWMSFAGNLADGPDPARDGRVAGLYLALIALMLGTAATGLMLALTAGEEKGR